MSKTAFCAHRGLADFGEATPEEVGDLKGVLGEIEVHKLILLGPGKEIDDLREEAEATFAGEDMHSLAPPHAQPNQTKPNKSPRRLIVR